MGEIIAVRRPERQCVDLYHKLGPVAEKPGYTWFEGRSAVDGGGTRLMEVADFAEPPLFMRVSDSVAAAVADALRPPVEASARHLDDAIEIRDRLLDIVDRVVPVVAGASYGPPAPPPNPLYQERTP